jgi:hypothetical protein
LSVDLRVDPKRARHGKRELVRLRDLTRVRIDGDGLLSDRERIAVPVRDRPAGGGDDDGLVVLAHGERCVLGAHHGLEPERAGERRDEEDGEDGREDDDAPVRGRELHFGPRVT